MKTTSVRAGWIGGQSFLLRDRAGFPILMDQPMGVNAADLLPLSLIGCVSWEIVSILKKQRQQVTGLKITAESDQDEEPPWRLRRIRICYQVRGRGLNEARIRRAVELSESKYCPVYATLRDAVEITSRIEIEDEPV